MFARCVAIDPKSAGFHGNLGEALRTMRQFHPASVHLRKAVQLDPTNVQAWNSLGLLSFDLGRNLDAERAYREAIRLRPRFVHAHINLGNTLLAIGRPREAMESLREAIRIEPNNFLALINLGRILSETREPGLCAEAKISVAGQLRWRENLTRHGTPRQCSAHPGADRRGDCLRTTIDPIAAQPASQSGYGDGPRRP